MNNFYRKFTLLLFVLASLPFASFSRAQDNKSAAGEQFFIVASIDLSRSQLLLKHPTEVTTLLNITGNTKIVDESGKSISPSDLRTGDTVWVVSSGSAQSATALRIRKGPMTEAELHQLYLDYPQIK